MIAFAINAGCRARIDHQDYGCKKIPPRLRCGVHFYFSLGLALERRDFEERLCRNAQFMASGDGNHKPVSLDYSRAGS
jgi:hypothetical protein